MTDKKSGGLSSFRVKQRRALYGYLAAAAFAATGASVQAGTATYDFGTDPATIPGVTIAGNNDTPWQASGGNPGGFLAITYPEGGQYGAILFPDADAGKLVKAFKFEADLRVGNSTGDRAADGFSVSFARGNDPVLADLGNQGNFAGGIAEGGTTTGIAVCFDTWSGNTLPDGPDLEGIIVRVDNVTINRTALPTRHGACDDNTSLQTGPRNADYWANSGDPRSPESWAGLCWKPFVIDLDETGKLSVTWKGRVILDKFQTTYFPSIGRLVLAGRTGGANENTHFDNLRINTILADSPIVGLPSGTACGFTIPIADAGPVSPVASTIVMKVDGAVVTPSVAKDGAVTVLTFDAPGGSPYASGSTHPVEVSFTDSNGKAASATRSFVVPAYSTIPATAATTSFTAGSSGFSVRVHQIDMGRGPGDANSTVNAEQQLGGGYFTATGAKADNIAQPSGTADGLFTVDTINWNQDAPGAVGNFSVNSDPAIEDAPIPGIPGTTDSNNNIAAEILTFLELKKGCHVLGVNSDDGFTVRSGHGIGGTLLGQFDGGRGAADTTFRVYVAQDGVYPIRLSWWEGGGGANVEFFSVDATGKRHLVNDRTDPLAIKAYSAGRTAGFLASTSPYPGYTGAEPRPVISATFRNDLTSVDSGSIKLIVDGATVAATPTTANGRTTVSFTPSTAYKFNTPHTARVEYTINGVAGAQNFNFSVRSIGLSDLSASSFSIEAENFDFDSGKSQTAASTMPYAGGEYDGLGSVHNVDYFQPENVPDSPLYRIDENPNVPMDSQTGAGTLDVLRPGFEVTTNYKIGWVGGGEWYNYTRTIPAGNYKIIGAQSHGDGAGTADRLVASFGVVISGKGTQNQTVVGLGSYSDPSAGGWGNNGLAVAQLNGKDAVVKLPAGEITIRATMSSGDFDWFTLSPTTDPVSSPSAVVSPASTLATTGGNRVLPLTATITDMFRSGPVAQSSIKLMVNGADVTASSTITKTATGYTVEHKPANGPVSYVLTYADTAGTYTNTGSYYSIYNAGNFVIEAEDFNHGGGQTQAAASVMPLVAGAYNNLAAVHDVDYHVTGNTPDSNLYRIGEDPNVPMDSTGDRNRGTFTLASNYKIGWADATEWYNYTRTIPAGTYNIYAAISHGDQGATAGSMALIDGATTNELGIFNMPGGTGGWGNNRLIPLTDIHGGMVAVPLSGAKTLRYTVGGGDFDYFVLTPGTATTALQDVTAPTDTITAFGGTSPGAEGVANAINNSSSKYLNFGKDPTSAPFEGPVGFVVTPAKGATVLKGVRFYTANDAENRDPADYVLEGSNDGTTFTQISAGPLALPSTRTPGGQNMLNGPSQTVTFANTTAYTTYRVTFNNVKNNTTANSMQIGEVELLGEAGSVVQGPRLTVTRSGANLTITWTDGVLQSSSTVNGGYTPVAGTSATGGTHTHPIGAENHFFRAVK